MATAATSPFPYGVASFDPSATGVILWTRGEVGGPLRWELASDEDFTDLIQHGEAAGSDDPSGAERGEVSYITLVEDLAPATDHFYRFVRDGATSPVGRTRTLRADEDDRSLRLGLTCCGDFSAGHFGVYRALADADVDAVVHLGDYVYADPEGELRGEEDPKDAVTRAEYRARYEQVRADPDLQALHQRHPMFAVIDDHDLTDNAYTFGAKNHDPETQGPWSERRDGAAEERGQWLPIRADGPPGRDRLGEWRSVGLGAVGELVLLDARLAGRTEPADAPEGPDRRHPDRTMLGAAQMQWATERVADRSRPWSVVVSSVVMNPMEIPLPGHMTDAGIFPYGYAAEDGVAFNSDAWDGYVADRARMVAAMRTRGSGAVVLSGDVHSSWAWEGPVDEQGPVAVELTCPAATSAPMGEVIPLIGRELDAMVDAKHGVSWAELYGHGYMTVDIAADRVVGTWWFCDPEDVAAQAERRASWTTLLDRPGHLVETDALDPAAGPDLAPHPDRTASPAVPPRPATLLAATARHQRRVRLLVTGAATAVVLLAGGRRGR